MNVEEVEMTEDEYEEKLNEIYEDVQIGNLTFSPGRILRELDPVAFRCGLSEQPVKWVCGNCGKVYEDRDKADECCEEDAGLEG